MADEEKTPDTPQPEWLITESKPPNSAKVWLKRSTTKPEDHATMIPYLATGEDSRYSYWRPPATESEFEVSADIAAAAIASGAFVERGGSKTKLKAPPPALGLEPQVTEGGK